MPRKGQLKHYNIEQVTNLLTEKGLRLLEYKGVNTPIGVECKHHGKIHIWYQSLKNNSTCKQCANKKISEKYKKKAKQTLQSKIGTIQILQENTYVDSTTPATFFCTKHKLEYVQAPRDIVAGWRGCNKCRRSSLGETKIVEYFLRNKIKFKREYCIDKSINPETGRSLPYDFYIPDLNLLLEYDGEQHYIELPHFTTDLRKRQLLDKIKTDVAEKQGYILLRIPYWQFETIELILEEQVLNNLN